jgi:hypothetical protein
MVSVQAGKPDGAVDGFAEPHWRQQKEQHAKNSQGPAESRLKRQPKPHPVRRPCSPLPPAPPCLCPPAGTPSPRPPQRLRGGGGRRAVGGRARSPAVVVGGASGPEPFVGRASARPCCRCCAARLLGNSFPTHGSTAPHPHQPLKYTRTVAMRWDCCCPKTVGSKLSWGCKGGRVAFRASRVLQPGSHGLGAAALVRRGVPGFAARSKKRTAAHLGLEASLFEHTKPCACKGPPCPAPTMCDSYLALRR